MWNEDTGKPTIVLDVPECMWRLLLGGQTGTRKRLDGNPGADAACGGRNAGAAIRRHLQHHRLPGVYRGRKGRGNGAGTENGGLSGGNGVSAYFSVPKPEKKRRKKPKPGELEDFCLECKQIDCTGWCEELYEKFGIRDAG